MFVGLVALGLACLTGCPSIRAPGFFQPGSAGQKRAEALQFDPYPLDDIGPPVAGGRPRSYARPLSQAAHANRYMPRPHAVQPVPWPTLSVPNLTAPPAAGLYPAPPPSISPPPAYPVQPPY